MTAGATFLIYEVVQFFDAAFRLIYTPRTSPETKFGEMSSDAVQARDGEGRAWEKVRTTLPGILAERSHSDPPQLRSGG